MKSARTKATEIPRWVKEIVNERDGGICVICQTEIGLPEAHYIRRSQGGMGIPKNVFCAGRECHRRFDEGDISARAIVREHFMKHYPDWSENDLIYQRWPEELRYENIRTDSR